MFISKCHLCSDNILPLFRSAGDSPETILFCDSVHKVGRSNTNVKLLVLSSRHIYLFDSSSVQLTRAIALADIEFITLARSHGDGMVLHHKTVGSIE